MAEDEISYSAYRRVTRLQHKARKLGFAVRESTGDRTKDGFALFPLKTKSEHTFPSLDANDYIAEGTITEIESFLIGVEWITDYHLSIGAVTKETIERSEQDARNEILIASLKKEHDNQKKEMDRVAKRPRLSGQSKSKSTIADFWKIAEKRNAWGFNDDDIPF
jgi:hypothetical protein